MSERPDWQRGMAMLSRPAASCPVQIQWVESPGAVGAIPAWAEHTFTFQVPVGYVGALQALNVWLQPTPFSTTGHIKLQITRHHVPSGIGMCLIYGRFPHTQTGPTFQYGRLQDQLGAAPSTYCWPSQAECWPLLKGMVFDSDTVLQVYIDNQTDIGMGINPGSKVQVMVSWLLEAVT